MAQKPTQWNWHVFQRWQQYDAELRVNLVRILSIGVFYLIHLANHSLPRADAWLRSTIQLPPLPIDDRLGDSRHYAVTALAFAWLMLALVIHTLLRNRTFPHWLPAVSVAADSLLLTAILLLSSGAASPLVSGYYLIIVMAGLRYDLRLVRGTAICTLAGYLFVLGATRWPMGILEQQPLPTVPRYHQLMMMSAMILLAVTVGQMVRQIQRWFFDNRRPFLDEDSGERRNATR